LAIWQKEDEEKFKYIEKSSCNFGQNLELNRTPLYLKLERQYRFKVKLNYYWINQKKIKPSDIIRFLIGQFDLIMSQIKNLIMFKKLIWVKLKDLIKCKDLIIL
jgi:hypothetical protein